MSTMSIGFHIHYAPVSSIPDSHNGDRVNCKLTKLQDRVYYYMNSILSSRRRGSPSMALYSKGF